MISPGGNASATVNPGSLLNRYQLGREAAPAESRLSWEELLERQKQKVEERRQAREKGRQLGSALAGMSEALESLALDADRIGEGFRYTVQQKLTLTRQKSALVPVIDEPVALARYSIYDRAAHPRFPLFGVKVKNTTGQHLQQGPIAVFENGSYLGDSRLPDLGPGEERLLSYAMDLGVEMRPELGAETQLVQKLEVVKGQVRRLTLRRQGTTYQVRNRSGQERTLLVEHPLSPGWSTVGKTKPVEVTKTSYRFQWKVPAGGSLRETVTEERTDRTAESLTWMKDERVRETMHLPQAGKEMRQALARVLDYRARQAKLAEETAGIHSATDAALKEQQRLRTNLGKLPEGSAAYKRHLEKFDREETEVERLRKQAGDKHDAEQKLQKEYAAFLASLTVR
jgi:hypothetical protein